MKLSICIPTYNRAEFLPATLESIAAQATDEIEIAVSDIASTDHTAAIVESYRERLGRMRWFRSESNRGADANYLTAVEISTGEYCWILGSDDPIAPGAIAELLDVPMLLVHVSAKEAMHEIQRAQARGLKIYGETCPQYLFLSEEDFEKPGDEGSKCVCSPPPRGTDNQEHIWTGLAAGTFHVLSSDHAAFKYNDVRGKKLPGADKSFRLIPNGVPGVETRLPLLFSEGVNKGRLTLQQFVALSSKSISCVPCTRSEGRLVIW